MAKGDYLLIRQVDNGFYMMLNGSGNPHGGAEGEYVASDEAELHKLIQKIFPVLEKDDGVGGKAKWFTHGGHDVNAPLAGDGRLE